MKCVTTVEVLLSHCASSSLRLAMPLTASLIQCGANVQEG